MSLLARAQASYVEIPASSSPTEALALLGERAYAVVVAEDPVAVLTAADLRTIRAGQLSNAVLPPIVLAEADQSVQELAASPAVTLLDLEPPAVVLVRGATVVGVLTIDALAEELARGGYEPEPTTMGPHGLQQRRRRLARRPTQRPRRRAMCSRRLRRDKLARLL